MQMDSKHKVLLKDIGIFAVGNMGSRMIVFFLVPLYTNCLTTDQYGIAELIFTFSLLLTPFLTIAVQEAILRFGLMRGVKRENVIFNSTVIFFISSLICVLITPLFRLYDTISEWRWYLCAYVISCAATSIFPNYLKVKDQNRLFAGISIIQAAVLAVVNILLLAVFHLGIQGYLIANISAHFVAALVAVTCGGIIPDLKKASFDKPLLKNMILYSSPLVLNCVAWWAIHCSDKIMLEFMASASALGLYTLAMKIPTLLNVVIMTFSQAWGISSIKEYESSNDNAFYHSVFEMYSFFTFGLAIVIISIIRPFMNIFVGSNFREAWVFVPLLLVGAAFSSVSAFYGTILAAMKKSVSNMMSTLIGAVANIVINYLGIKLYGIWGAVFGTVSAYVIIVIIRMCSVHRNMRMDLDFFRFQSNIMITVIFSIIISLNLYQVISPLVAIALLAIVNHKQLKIIKEAFQKRFSN